MNDLNFITQKKKDLKFPIAFLGLVLLISLGLFLFNLKISSDIDDLNTKISQREADISILKNDPKVQVYSLIDINRNTIENMEKRSKITDYLKHVDAISKKYEISFDNFDITNGKVSLQASTQSSEKGIAYKKINKFISEYRKEEFALLDLKFITNFEGMDQIKFNLEFDIK
ncbi:hypothetical protein HUU51_00050 [Candidatus Gracilibacteria bacterium]|nr:hypothetical protein [Candidatus Gracilibacteria bacterium]